MRLFAAREDEVWCTDIDYVSIGREHAYLCAVMDWHSRKLMGWAMSNTLENGLCLTALNQALSQRSKGQKSFTRIKEVNSLGRSGLIG